MYMLAKVIFESRILSPIETIVSFVIRWELTINTPYIVVRRGKVVNIELCALTCMKGFHRVKCDAEDRKV